jgi:hypothetical protein
MDGLVSIFGIADSQTVLNVRGVMRVAPAVGGSDLGTVLRTLSTGCSSRL